VVDVSVECDVGASEVFFALFKPVMYLVSHTYG
jgi:hypothetical protein